MTLWGELGENFDESAVRAMSEPVVAAFSAMAAKQYMGKYIYYNKKNSYCLKLKKLKNLYH